MTDDIFDKKNEQVADPATPKKEETPTNQPDPLVEQLAKIVDGEGRQKYESIAKALESIPNAQKHISTLEQENAKLRETLEKASKIDEVLAKLQERKEETTSIKGLEEEDVARLVESFVSKKEIELKQEENRKLVVSTLQEAYGSEAEKVYKERAAELEMSLDELNALVRSKPKAALRLIGVVKKETAPVKSTGSVSTEQFNIQGKQPPKSIMGPSSTKDLVDAWKAAAPSDN